MKKLVCVLLALLIAASGLSACTITQTPSGKQEFSEQTQNLETTQSCEHEYNGPDCAPMVCIKCGERANPTGDHDWGSGDCVTPAQCKKCGAYRKASGHTYTGGSCTEPQVCSVCGAAGGTLPHKYEGATCVDEGVCIYCGATTPPLGHKMQPATCTEPATCSVCGYTEGDPLGHANDGTCTRCGAIVGSGYGDSVVEDLTLPDPSAIYVMHFTHSGRHNIIVQSYDATGDKDHLINEIGDYDGTILLLGKSPIMLNIEADGVWEYTITKLEKTSDTSFSGHGDFVTPLFKSNSKIWHFTHDGGRNFVVVLWTSDGRDWVVNEIGSYDASQVAQIPNGSYAFFEITADGDWSINPG